MINGLKPYSAMKDSGVRWLGEVPEHWEVAPAFAVYRPRQVKNTGLVEPTVLSLSYGRIIVKAHEKLRGLVPESFDTYQIVEPGNIIVRTTDLQNDRTSLRIGHARHRGIITAAYMCLETKPIVMNEFGYQYLNAYDLLKIIYGFGSGLRQNLDFSDIKRMPVLVPPREEQAAIVRFLDHADRRIRRYIRAKQKLIKLLEEQKQAIIHRAVTRGLDPNVRLKPSGVEWLGDVPEHWEVLTLRRVITRAVDGPHHSPRYLDSGIPFLSARNIKADRWSLGDAKYISEADYAEFSKRVVPEVGDVLYTKGGTTGVARAVDLRFRFQVWVHVAVLKVKRHKVLPEYLALVLNSPRCYEQAQLFTRGATNQDLGLGRMKGIVLALPGLSEQEELLRALEERTRGLNDAAEKARREIELLREYRIRLIADVVTGKLDVREAAARLPDEVEEAEPLDESGGEVDADEARADDVDQVSEEAEA
jgi:type I restriction enzyme S subunit